MKKFLLGFVHAGRGIGSAMREELNLKVMLAVAVAAVALGSYQGLSRLEWVAIVLCIGLVLALELMNSAAERLVDLICPGQDPRAGLIKDMLAGGVLLASVAAAVVGALVFLG
jgi:diacylglycerol kinase